MLILASASAARTALLAGAGVRFVASPAKIDERALEAAERQRGAGAAGIATALAVAKALAVAATHPGALVIGADQVLAHGTDLLHKPADRAAARRQLHELRGSTHRLHAGIALARDAAVLWHHVATASLTLRQFSDAEAERILALEADANLAAVGGYRLEGPSIQLFERVEGDYFAILGLPLLPLLAALRTHAPGVLEGFT